jgi:hypothetical protein
MYMSIEIVKIQREGEGFSLWVDDEQDFDVSKFLKVLSPLNVGKSIRVHESFGPAEFIDNIQTSNGVFSLYQQFDEFPGSTIYSDSDALMENILSLMLESGFYHVR